MSPFEILAASGAAAAMVVIIYIAMSQGRIGSSGLAAALSGAFAAFTVVTIATEGVIPVWLNHTQNLWGVQVWWDLLISVGVALFFVVPRARDQGMNVIPWIVLVGTTASIGLLAMVARLFWLEQRAEA